MTPTRTSRRLLLATAILSALAGAVRPAAAQAVTTPEAKARLAVALSDLRNLVTAQEAYFAENNRYSNDLTKTKWKPSAGNTGRLVTAEPNGWSAELTGAGIEGSCVISINVSESQLARTAKEKKSFPEGEPACDGDGENEDLRWAKESEAATTGVLARIARLQEQQFGRTGAYATSVDQLQGYTANARVTVTLTVAPSDAQRPGWFASATHARYPGSECTIRSGQFAAWMRPIVMRTPRPPMGNDFQVLCAPFKK